jgi:ribosomal protein S18 acetylase RimI-like enzyme
MKYYCSKLEIHNCKDIVKIHKQAFKNFFLTQLGDFFLNVYYKASLKADDCVCIGIFDENSLLKGFAIGSLCSKGYHKKLLKNNIFSFSIVFLYLMFSKPKSLIRLKNNLEKKANEKDDGLYAELLSIAVSTDSKGQGLGKLLLSDFEETLRKHNVKKIALTTDKYKNEDTLAFYEKTGYNLFYEFNAYPNRTMCKLIKNINFNPSK